MRRLIAVITIAIAAFTVAAQTLSPSLYDDTAPVLTFTGTWSESTLSGAYLGAYSSTTDPAAELTADIAGDGVTLYFVRSASGGDATLCLNAVCSTVSNYDAVDSMASVNVSGLGQGTHTLTYTKADASGASISIDALYIHPNETEATPELTPEPTYDEVIVVGDVEGRLVRELTAGDVLIASLLVVLVLSSVGTFLMTTLGGSDDS